MIPLWVLTGFLGSGKTTLLGQLLKSPAFSRTAVIINEFGEIGLDHDLIETSEESFVTLQTGCLCCALRGDLVLTLEDLLRRRNLGLLPPFERVVVETSGLADPAPILQALMLDAVLNQSFAMAGVITTVDAVTGLGTLDRHAEAIKQVALADRLILTKTDLLAAPPSALAERLARLNPTAAVITACFGRLDAPRVFADGTIANKAVAVERWLAAAVLDKGRQIGHRHDAEVGAVALVREAPIRAVSLTLLLEVLAEHCGSDLLRLKGLVQIAESPERPAVIHGVQHVFHPPTWLERWPSPDRRSRLVFIGRNLSQAWIEALLTALEAEVAEVSAAAGQPPIAAPGAGA
jgi:G3E family GTPase